MYRHSPNRHQKSKGFRLKHVLQICVLVGVCFWLIYQVKHSHDKRKQFDENDANTSRNVEMNNAVLKLGRKDLNPQEKGPNKDLESHDEDEEEIVEEDKNEEENGEQDKNEEEIGEEIEEADKHEEESEEEDKREEEIGEEETGEVNHEEETGEEDKHEEENGEEDKHEEEIGIEDEPEKEEQEEDIETEEKADKGRAGDDGVNEQEQEKTDSNVNQEEEFIDEEKDKKDTNEKETGDKDDGDKDSQHNSIEDHDHDEGARNTRVAREEQYKGDDASSAVTHDGQITSTGNVIGSIENQASSVVHKNKHNNTDGGNTGQNTTDVDVRELEVTGNGNLTSDEEKSFEVLDSISRGNSSLTSITALESNGQSETINDTDTQESSIKNETEIIMSEFSHRHSVTDGNVTSAEGTNFETLVMEQSDNSTVALDNTKLDSNSSSSTATKNVEENLVESRDSSTNSEFVSSETLAQSNESAENKDGSKSTTIVESTNDGNENPENVDGTEGTYEKSDSSNTEDTDEVQHDSIDSSDISVPVDDKENHIDLDTLPDIRTEGSNSEEVAEE